MDAMKKEGRPFQGCLYFGLMLTQDGPKVIEYNSRFGDPETQVVLPRLENRPGRHLRGLYRRHADGRLEIQWSDDAAACVVMASGGYPKSYPKGIEIKGLGSKTARSSGATVYHAGTAYRDGRFLTNGGRVLGVTACGATLDEALIGLTTRLSEYL